MRLDVVPIADAITPADLYQVSAIVVDVIRASTTIVTALVNGCAAIVPVADGDAARARAAALGGGALVAGERRGETIAGFMLGNSPLEFTAERVRGRTVVFTTSNGTRALLAARAADAIAVGGLVNLGAVAAWAVARGRDVTVVCAGERGALSLEDHVCAGLLIDRLTRLADGATLTAAAEVAMKAGQQYEDGVARLAQDSAWARRLASRGRAADIAACLALDSVGLVPVYLADVDKIVLPPR